MAVLLHFDRSEAVAEAYGVEATRRTVEFDAPDGQWVQLTYDAIHSQDGGFLYGFDVDKGVWIGPDDEPFSDIVIEFREDPWN